MVKGVVSFVHVVINTIVPMHLQVSANRTVALGKADFVAMILPKKVAVLGFLAIIFTAENASPCASIYGVNKCRPQYARCLSSPDAAFYERCCDRFLCLDSNGQTTNNGTCRVDPTVTTTPFPCSPLHTECVVGGSENCCGDAKCSNATQVANEEGPEIQSGFCRNENETAPFCSGQTQFCLENACCPEFFCNLDQKSQRCQSEKPECRKEQELCEENGCCTGLICGIDKDNRFGQCVNIPTCGLEGQLCLNGTCCTGFFCDFARTEGANVGECSTIVKTTTTENEPTITEPTTTTVKTTTATLPTTTTSQGSCIAQGNLCLLDLLIDTCCAGFKCTGLLLGTCKPI